MKKLLLVVCLALSSMCAMAQNGVGKWSLIPHIGVSVVSMTSDYFPSDDVTWKTDTKFRSNVAGGLDLEYQYSPSVAFSGGLWYREGGTRYKDLTISMDETEGTGRAFHDAYVRLNYLAVPLMAHVYLAKGLSLNGGIEPAFLIKQRSQYQMQSYTYDSQKKSWQDDVNRKYTDDSNENYQTFMLSIPVGVSYEYEHVILDARYEFGLTKVFKDNLSDARTHGLVFTMGYRLGL